MKDFENLDENERFFWVTEATNALSGLKTCTREWSAWQVGTMSENDFVDADWDNDVILSTAISMYNAHCKFIGRVV